jgi:hypothetical protein
VSSSNSSTEPLSRGCAFGLEVDADFGVDGLLSSGAALALPSATLRLSTTAALDRLWSPDEARRISEERLDASAVAPDRTIDAHPELGYRLYARDFGLCLISPDGERLLCAPPPVASWRWQRFLAGRCLPIAALLRGYEVFHAGAVALDGGVVAIAGPTGLGKTSLTLQLVLRGARFFTDDVLVLESGEAGGVLAHPGLGLVNIRAREYERLDEAAVAGLGDLLGTTGSEKLHYAMLTAAEPQPLRGLYFLRPAAGSAAATIRPMVAPDPLRLLTSTFISQVRPPQQLASLLDVCARLATSVPMFEISMGSAEDARTLAERLAGHTAAEVAR